MMRKIFLLFALIPLLTACISTKKRTYFQGKPKIDKTIKKLQGEAYKLQINDVLAIEIVAEDASLVALFATKKNANSAAGSGNLYFDGYTVDLHGNIRIPYIGEINVLGYTEKEVRQKIEAGLTKYLKNPETIFVKVKLAGIRFTVLGEVGNPGTVNLQQSSVNIIEAIANSGDINETGNRSEITIIRKSLDATQKFTLDITNIDVFNDEHFYILPNDIIYVPPLEQKALGTGSNGLQTFSTIVTVISFLASTVLLLKNI